MKDDPNLQKFIGKNQTSVILRQSYINDGWKDSFIQKARDIEQPIGSFSDMEEFKDYVLFNQELIPDHLYLNSRIRPISLCPIYLCGKISDEVDRLTVIYVPAFDEYSRAVDTDYTSKAYMFRAYSQTNLSDATISLVNFDARQFSICQAGRWGTVFAFGKYEDAKAYLDRNSDLKWTGMYSVQDIEP
jgi:hypothetical protein